MTNEEATKVINLNAQVSHAVRVALNNLDNDIPVDDLKKWLNLALDKSHEIYEICHSSYKSDRAD